MLNSFFPNLILSVLFTFTILILLFPLDSFINKLTKLHVTKSYLIIFIYIFVFIVLFLIDPLLFPIKFIMSLFSFFMLIFGFSLDRRYIYMLASILIGGSFLLLVLGLTKYAEYLSALFYLLLILGVLKDLFYEKIFK